MIESKIQRTQTFKPEGPKIVNSILLMKFWLRQLWRRLRTTTGTCAALWSCLPSSPAWSPRRRSRTWSRNSSVWRSLCPSSLARPSSQRRSGWTLSDLVTAESRWLFDCSKNDPEFLSLSVEEWKTDDQFMEAEKFIKTLKCTNPGVDKATLNKGCDRL